MGLQDSIYWGGGGGGGASPLKTVKAVEFLWGGSSLECLVCPQL